MAYKSSNHLFFRSLVEIDQHISAEDQIERALYRIRVGKQIDTSEAHNFLDFRHHSHRSAEFFRSFQHESAEVIPGDLARLIDGKRCRSGFFEYSRCDVGPKNLCRPALLGRKIFQQEHRERIRLLARCATRTPDVQITRSPSSVC